MTDNKLFGDPAQDSVKAERFRSRRVVDGAVLTTASTLIQGLGQILVLALLARFISTAEFGLMTATMVVIGFGRQVAEALIRPVVIQSENLTHRDTGTASALSWLFGLAMMALIWGAADPFANLFSEPGIAPVLSVLATVFLIQAPSFVAEGLLQRDLEFGRLALGEILSFVLGYTLVGVTLALTGAGVWALVWANIAQVGTKTLYLVLQKPLSLRLAFDRGSARRILWMSGGFSSAKMLNSLAIQADYLVVMAAMNSAALGIYGRAYQLVSMPVTLCGHVFERVMFPIYSRLQSNLPKVARHYGRAVALSFLLMAPISACLVVLAPEIVRLILGPDWSDVVLPMQILAASLMFRMGYKINDPLTKGLGLVYRRTWRLAIYLSAVILFATLGVPWGLAGVSAGVSLAIVLNFLLMAHLSISYLGVSWRWFAKQHLRGLLLAGVLFPYTAAIAISLRETGLGHVTILLLVLVIMTCSLAVALLILPNRVIGPDIKWLARKIGSRLQPTSSAQTSQPSRQGVLVELGGLAPDQQAQLATLVIERLNKQGIPATALMSAGTWRVSSIGNRLRFLRLVVEALKRNPRAMLAHLLMLYGNDDQQSETWRRTQWGLFLAELVHTAWGTPGVHVLDQAMGQRVDATTDCEGRAAEQGRLETAPDHGRFRPDLLVRLGKGAHDPDEPGQLGDMPPRIVDVNTDKHEVDLNTLARNVADRLASDWQYRNA